MADIFDRFGKVSFVPVVAAAVLEAIYKEKYILNGKQLGPQSKNSIYPYNKMLVNPVHSKGKVEEAKLNIRDEVILFSDSGGLQELNQGVVKQTPEEVVLWQEKNCHVGFSFDSIPFTFADGDTGAIGKKLLFDEARFIEHAEKSARNIRLANSVRENPDFKLYAIIQGRKYEEYVQWLNILKKEAVEGYCVKCPNTDPVNMAESCLFAYFNLDKPIHFLGVENFTRAAVCCYLSKYFKHPITFDGSSWSMGSRFRLYRLPFSISKAVTIKSKPEDGEEIEDAENFSDIKDLSFCNCPACQEAKDVQALNEDLKFGVLLSIHNLYNTVSVTKLLEVLIQSRPALDSFVRHGLSENSAEGVITAFDFIDCAVEKGYAFAKEKYRHDLTPNKEVIRQKSIFDFIQK